MRISEAVAALGVQEPEDRDLCIVVFHDGKPKHAPLRRVAERDIDEFGDVYLTSGLFARDSIQPSSGRTEANLREILWLPFDADLADFAGGSKETYWEYMNDELDVLLDAQRDQLEEVFRKVGLPIHRLDRTGYGLCAYVRISHEIADQVTELRAAHRRLIARINTVAGGRLVDPQVSDAGTRFTRLVPCLNTKGHTPRQAFTVYQHEGALEFGDLADALGTETPAPPRRVIPEHSRGLDANVVDAIIAILQPSWTLGQKHAMGLAVGGILAKAGVPEPQAMEIVARLSSDDEKPWDRAAAVRRSYERVRSGLDVKGFYGLRELIPVDALTQVDAILSEHWKQTQATVVTPGRATKLKGGNAKSDRPDCLWPDPPAVAFHGWFGHYLELVEPTTEAPNAFHLGAALTLAGAAIGRSVWAEYASERLFANLYTVLIGASGSSRKDTAIKRALAFAVPPPSVRELPNPPFRVVTDVSSAEGLIGTLETTPNTLLYLTELSMLLRNARRKGTSTILPRLIEAWDTPNRLSNLSKGNAQEAINPYLSVIAATQPGILAAEITIDDIHSGFANRWLYMVGAGKEPRPTPPPLDKKEAWKLYRQLELQINQAARRGPLVTAKNARELWNAWYLTKNDPQNEAKNGLKVPGINEESAAMSVRLPVLAQKIALIFAITDGAKAIEAVHLEAAIALVDWMWEQVQRLLAQWGIGIDSQIENRILDVLSHTGPLKKRDLQRKCSNRKWSAADFDRVFRAMQNNQTIGFDEEGKVGLRDD